MVAPEIRLRDHALACDAKLRSISGHIIQLEQINAPGAPYMLDGAPRQCGAPR
jgi:hypothetical protein